MVQQYHIMQKLSKPLLWTDTLMKEFQTLSRVVFLSFRWPKKKQGSSAHKTQQQAQCNFTHRVDVSVSCFSIILYTAFILYSCPNVFA